MEDKRLKPFISSFRRSKISPKSKPMKKLFTLVAILISTALSYASDVEVDVLGCTDPMACNYNPAANISDGSCYYSASNDACTGAQTIAVGSTATVDNTCSTSNGSAPLCWTDGVQNDVWFKFVAPASGAVTIATSDAVGGTLHDSQIAVYATCGGSFLACDEDAGAGYHASLTLTCATLTAGNTYYIQVDGFAGERGTCTISVSAATIAGCTNPTAANYNACATFNDGSCNNLGCTNATACNYNALATVDDGSCCFSTCGTLTVTSGLFPNEMGYSIVNSSNTTELSGSGATSASKVCLVGSCHQLRLTDSFGDGWNSAVYTLKDNSNNIIVQGTFPNTPLYNAFTKTVAFTLGGGTTGCTNSGACNYNPAATCDDGSCEYTSCLGCTNATACNYNAAATINDGSCCFQNCVTITMNDNLGDTWGDGYYQIKDINNVVLFTGTMTDYASTQTRKHCLAAGCYYMVVVGGTFGDEITWSLAGGTNGTISGNGTTITTLPFAVGVNNCFGCTVATACNYSPWAVFSDNTSCINGPCVAGDNPWTAITTSPSVTTTCTNYNGTFTGATISPVAQSTVVTGQDVWYKFTALHPAVSITVSAPGTNVVVELKNSAYQMIDSENLVGNGATEKMNFGGLTIGQVYYVGIRNYNSSVGAGAFSVCLRYLRYTTTISGTGPFTTCSTYKASYLGTGVTYRYEFTQQTSPFSTFTYNGSDVIVFSNIIGLSYGRSYNSKIFAIHSVTNGLGATELIEVAPPSFTTMTIGAQPLSELKSTDQCSAGPRLRWAVVTANPWICGSTAWQWEFTKVNPTTYVPIGTAFTKMVNSNSNLLNLNTVSQIEYGATYSVRIRPYFGVDAGTYGNAQIMCIVTSAMAVENNKFVDVTTRFAEDNEEVFNMTVYPNPSNGATLNVQMPQLQQAAWLSILDVTGKQLYRIQLAEGTTTFAKEFDNTLANGLYFVELKQGNETTRVKWVVTN